MITLCTWNVTGLMSSAYYLSNLLDSEVIDVCGISEHWLYQSELHFLNSIHSDYTGLGVCDSELNIYRGRIVGKGGVALLWNKKYNSVIKPLCIDNDRIIGIQFQQSRDCYIYIIQVYLPSANHGISVYRDYIEVLYDLISMYSQLGKVIIMGDFNAHLNGGTFFKDIDARGKALCDLSTQFCMSILTTLPVCSGKTSSYVSYDGKYQTLIDHIFVSNDLINSVSRCHIVDDNCLNVSSYRPVLVNLELEFSTYFVSTNNRSVQWNRVSEDNLYSYAKCLDGCLYNSVDRIPVHDVYYCIDKLYECIVTSSI